MVDTGTAYVLCVNPLSFNHNQVKSMSMHCIAYSNNATNNVETDMTPVTDPIITVQNGHYLPSQDVKLLWNLFCNADANRIRVATPTLRQVTTPFLLPVEPNLDPGSRPGVADLRQYPLTLRAMEEVQLLSFQNGAGAARSSVVIGISDGSLAPVPSGQIYTLRGTGSATQVANAWTAAAITWQDTLPAGRYAVCGGTGICATGVAFRVVFNEQRWRPGGLLMTTAKNFTHPMYRMGGLGIWGQFDAYVMPQIEFLSTSADTSQEIYLDILRIG